MATREEVTEARGRVDSLREQIAEAKLNRQRVDSEKVNDLTLDSLQAEENRLAAELAALRGETPVQETTEEGYIVPMGTVAVDTDVIKLNAEDAPPAEPVTLPGQTPEPVVVSVGEPETAEKSTTSKTKTTTTETKGA